jgi:hypothetical protein
MSTPLDMASLQAWLDRYRAAWESREAARAASLFTADASYRETPFDVPMRGPEGVREYWTRVTADQRDVQFQAKPIAVSGHTGIAEWNATFKLASSGATIELDGVFVLDFDSDGLCSSLREWWHVRQR